MIRVNPGSYFASKEENRNLNKFLKERYPNGVYNDRAFKQYIKEKYNAQYVDEIGYRDQGYFLFDDSKKALMFMMRFS